MTGLSWAALPTSFKAQSSQRISGNSVVEIIYDGAAVWVGTNNGLSRTTDGGLTWEIFDLADGMSFEEVSALGAIPGRLLAAGAHSEIIDDFEVPFGDGFNLSTNAGQNWFGSKPFQATSPGMLAYDIASAETVFFAGCFFGGLIRSFDGGSSWENVYVDSFAKVDFTDSVFNDLRNRHFAVTADTYLSDTVALWAGSAAGIQKFIYTDSLDFDTVIYYQNIDTQICIFQKSYLCDSADVAIGFHVETDTFACGRLVIKVDTIPCPTADTVVDRDTITVYPDITGNFVVALGIQKLATGKALWAACRPTFGGIMAVNFTRDDGQTWDTTLTDELVWDFGFQDTVIWAASNSGLLRSSDWGSNWESFSQMKDYSDTCPNQIISPEFFAVEVVGDTIWAGGADGLVRTTDDGASWRVFRGYVPIGTPGSTEAYAYPSPFSPHLGAGVTRIHHKPAQTGNVTVEIFDFAMNKVITLISNQLRVAGQECDEPWDGKDDDGEEVATGVYFFRVIGPGLTQWGKMVVLK
ncbi:MAG: hypothetical protein A2Z27_03765 [candidate division Zixibacteria bacterium RBG_16_50_21]|nr:MAG: hypothetical protein A2Z27_03765 [candidate division Zixibacteria bacterium RBG_16_50_21]